MRSITVSTDVFAKIWSLHAMGEDTEDSILRRVLWTYREGGISAPPFTKLIASPDVKGSGLFDSRNQVLFPEGFLIFRNYLGQDYSARVTGSSWTLDGDQRVYKSLNELSRAIGAKTENAWMNWFYSQPNGVRRPVSDMRTPDSIKTRAPQQSTDEQPPEPSMLMERENVKWRDDLAMVLKGMTDQVAPLQRIYDEVSKIRRQAGRSIPPSLEATVRRTLENHSSDSNNYLGGDDLFYMPEGKGAGIWGLRKK